MKESLLRPLHTMQKNRFILKHGSKLVIDWMPALNSSLFYFCNVDITGLNLKIFQDTWKCGLFFFFKSILRAPMQRISPYELLKKNNNCLVLLSEL